MLQKLLKKYFSHTKYFITLPRIGSNIKDAVCVDKTGNKAQTNLNRDVGGSLKSAIWLDNRENYLFKSVQAEPLGVTP